MYYKELKWNLSETTEFGVCVTIYYFLMPDDKIMESWRMDLSY